jgi:Rieske Fe-S protein
VDAIADGDALPAGRLEDPDDVDAVRVAITLKGALPAADLPSEEFVSKLRQEIADEATTGGRHRLSRRAVLGTAGAVAAAGAAGVVLDRGVLQSGTASSTHTAAQLEPVDGQWLSVATDTDLASGAPQRFSTPALVGFVTATNAGVVAVSAACTHLGCILQPNDAAGRFDCPCHRTAFGHDGRLLFSQLDTAPPPLTRLEVRRQGGNVEVLVPRTV